MTRECSGANMSANPKASVLLLRAAKGDADAQAGLADWCLEQATRTGHITQALAMAEFSARLAASQGAAEHRHSLARLLVRSSDHAFEIGDLHSGTSHRAEAIALLDELADEGNEEAAQEFIELVGDSPPELVAFAGRLRRREVAAQLESDAR